MSDTPIKDTQGLAGLAALAFKGRRSARIAGAVAAGELAHTFGTRLRNEWRSRHTYTVTVSEHDGVYADVHRWLDQAMTPTDRKAVEIVTGRWDEIVVVPEGGTTQPSGVMLRFSGRLRQRLNVDGHVVEVHVENEDSAAAGDRSRSMKTAYVEFNCGSVEGQQAVIALISRLHADRNRRTPRLSVAQRWGGWRRMDERPARPTRSVVLASGQMERLHDDMANFLARERWFVENGVPWHRGYLLWGPPGTGKTSAITALAGEFGLDVFVLSLGDLEDDGQLTDLVAQIGPRSVLLLEDIDTATAARDREATDPTATRGGASLAGLLNALDGIATPHGLITVLTSNRPDVLDPALVRPGRCDRVEHFAPLDADRARSLFAWLTGRRWDDRAWGPIAAPVIAAEVTQAVLNHPDDPAAAAMVLRAADAACAALTES